MTIKTAAANEESDGLPATIEPMIVPIKADVFVEAEP